MALDKLQESQAPRFSYLENRDSTTCPKGTFRSTKKNHKLCHREHFQSLHINVGTNSFRILRITLIQDSNFTIQVKKIYNNRSELLVRKGVGFDTKTTEHSEPKGPLEFYPETFMKILIRSL